MACASTYLTFGNSVEFRLELEIFCIRTLSTTSFPALTIDWMREIVLTGGGGGGGGNVAIPSC